MGAPKKVQPWFPKDDAEAVKAAAGEPYEGQDGKMYIHEDIAKASPKNPPVPAEREPEPQPDVPAPEPHPDATAPAVSESGPSAEDLDAVAADEAAKIATSAPPSAPNENSFRKAIPGGPTDPSYDADELDSTGTNKKDGTLVGPRGKNIPADVMSDEDRAAVAQKQEDRLRKGMSSTHGIDSTGKPKGEFEVEKLGVDKHGMRRPDYVDYSKPVQAPPPMVGPRGTGAPKDTFHKK